MVVRNAESMPALPDNWVHRGYHGGGNVVGILDALQGHPVIVAGSGEGVFDEVEEAGKICAGELETFYFACNDVGVYLPVVHHLVSLHADNLVHWAALRADKHERRSFRTHGAYDHPGIEFCWQFLTPTFALSGYFAMQIAFLMDASRIILCGCPGDGTKRFFDRAPRTDYMYLEKGVREQLELEMKRLPEFKEKVRSMSGFTREFFGGP